MRRGIVLALDLEKYDYRIGSQTVIRATEKTIESRIPPRLKVRREVSIELPHIIVLIDDPNDTVIGSLAVEIDTHADIGKTIYETELMENSGHIRGVWVDDKIALGRLSSNLLDLCDMQIFNSKYGLDTVSTDAASDEEGERVSQRSPLVFAMGDGNHSLATAKAWWEEVKASGLGSENHPARYALVEIQNCQDPTLVFEPINRLIEDIDVSPREDWDETSSAVGDGMAQQGGGSRLLLEFKSWLEETGQGPVTIEEGEDGGFHEIFSATDDTRREKGSPPSRIGYVLSGRRGCINISNPTKVLPVATFTDFIDPWLARESKSIKIDYVHETTAIDRECTPDRFGNIGFIFPSMKKSDLFKTVIYDGVLPRKTFSMGSSWDKRFYFEARRIR
jgi:hypothetical protein